MQRGHEWVDGELFDTLWEIFDEPEQARQETAILHVHPLNWPRHQWFASAGNNNRWHDGAVRLSSKLIALGIPHKAILEANAHDDTTSFLFMMLFISSWNRSILKRDVLIRYHPNFFH